MRVISVSMLASVWLAATLSTAQATSHPMHIDSVSPGSASIGSSIRIRGSHFGGAAAGHRVYISGASSHLTRYLTVARWSDTEIVATIPSGVSLGPSYIGILNPPGRPGPTDASNYVPFNVVVGLKPKGIGDDKTPLPKALSPVNPAVQQALQPKLKGGLTLAPVRTCRDLAAQAIDFRIVSRSAPFQGTVEIVGVVRNVGGTSYQSNPGQQSAQLYEGTRLVEQQAFQNLAPGQEVRVRFTRRWNASSPAEGEFPSTYKLWISYDPDISIDGNPNNDDCQHANDRRERSGAGINALFSP